MASVVTEDQLLDFMDSCYQALAGPIGQAL